MMIDQREHRIARPLTFDEKRAADAAFSGEPLCTSWSQSAQRIYEGLVAALEHHSYDD